MYCDDCRDVECKEIGYIDVAEQIYRPAYSKVLLQCPKCKRVYLF